MPVLSLWWNRFMEFRRRRRQRREGTESSEQSMPEEYQLPSDDLQNGQRSNIQFNHSVSEEELRGAVTINLRDSTLHANAALNYEINFRNIRDFNWERIFQSADLGIGLTNNFLVARAGMNITFNDWRIEPWSEITLNLAPNRKITYSVFLNSLTLDPSATFRLAFNKSVGETGISASFTHEHLPTNIFFPKRFALNITITARTTGFRRR